MYELVPGNTERKNGVVPLFCSVLPVIEDFFPILGRTLNLPTSQLLSCRRRIITFVLIVVRRYSFLAENVLTMVYSSLSTSLIFYQNWI